GVVGVDQALDALDHTDTGDEARPDGVAGPPGRQRRQLEERRVRVEQELDALASKQLAALPVPLDVLVSPAGACQRELRLDLGELLEQSRPSLRERRC